MVPVNRGWTEPDEGVTIYIANNGLHSDIVMPVQAQGLDWTPFVPKSDFAAPDPNARWVAFGSGEERVYLDTPRWRDITPADGLVGADRRQAGDARRMGLEPALSRPRRSG